MTSPTSTDSTAPAAPPPPARWLGLALGSLGVVYGDIGTSPLYAVRECFHADHGVAATAPEILGVASLLVWALTLVVTLKYIVFVLRADNQGDGGILAMASLLTPTERTRERRRKIGATLLLGLIGTALLVADGMITPVISVLGALEGLEVAAPGLEPAVLPLAAAILVGLFAIQRRGTGPVGALFAPVMIVWFAFLAGSGAVWIAREPSVLAALDPRLAFGFFARHGLAGAGILGAVVLCVTGAEALYADLGHFGRRPIRVAWLVLVYPALLLNYLGQSALLLARPEAVASPFFGLVPGAWLYPLIALSTAATIIASQALISGTFSLARQAVQLGLIPRLKIVHTSGKVEGQIYVPAVNAALLLGCLVLVFSFGESSDLAAAYGIAVTGTMLITTLLLYAVARRVWRWSSAWALGLTFAFLAVDVPFLAANVSKAFHGGWVPLLLGAVLFGGMSTWMTGRAYLLSEIDKASVPLDLFFASVEREKPVRVPGTAVFLTTTSATPRSLLHHFRHNRVLHERVLLVTVITAPRPRVPVSRRVEVEALPEGFHRVVVHYGFMETPRLPDALRLCERFGLTVDPEQVSYFLGRETLVLTGRSGLPRWRRALFSFLARNARPASAFFRLPPGRVMELGMQIEV